MRLRRDKDVKSLILYLGIERKRASPAREPFGAVACPLLFVCSPPFINALSTSVHLRLLRSSSKPQRLAAAPRAFGGSFAIRREYQSGYPQSFQSNNSVDSLLPSAIIAKINRIPATKQREARDRTMR